MKKLFSLLFSAVLCGALHAELDRKFSPPLELDGKKVLVLVNLKPAKLAGMLSEGMLLCAESPDGTLALMTPEKDLPAGSEVC